MRMTVGSKPGIIPIIPTKNAITMTNMSKPINEPAMTPSLARNDAIDAPKVPERQPGTWANCFTAKRICTACGKAVQRYWLEEHYEHGVKVTRRLCNDCKEKESK